LNQQLLPSDIKAAGFSAKTAALLLVSLCLSAFLIMGMYSFRQNDPYTDRVLALTGNAIQGHAIFQMNCATCHGLNADGRVGPSLKGIPSRRSQSSMIEQVTSGKTPPMPQFQPSAQEMADLLQYLNTL
jgi:mono/diheme cytochrome c family protein